MIYNLENKIDRERFIAKVKYYLDKSKKVDLTEKRKKRTLPQNSYLHLILSYFGTETGYTLEEVKRLYKVVNKSLYVYTKNEVAFLKSSKELDTKQMGESIERFKNYAAELGIILPDAENQEQITYAQEQVEKNSIYL